MRDIAAAADVSQSTVSRVLSGVPTRVPIAAETRRRVIEAARRLGYRPNPLARGLRGASTNLIGAVVRDFSDPFYAGAIEALVVESMAYGYNVVLGHAPGRLDEAAPLTTVLETRHTDAIILLGDMQQQPRLLDDLRNSVVPVVALWQGTSPLEFPTIDTDDRAGIWAGLEHLASLGHRRIAFVSAELPGDFRAREDAYRDLMHDMYDGVPPGYLERCPHTLAGGDAALRRLLALPEPPTAVATSTDLVAVGVLHAAHSLGVTVPELSGRLPRDPSEMALAVFTSAGCHLCRSLEPAIESLAGEPGLEVATFDEGAEAELWRDLEVPGSPYAVALAADGSVLAKGTFNNLAQLESVVVTAERRRSQGARQVIEGVGGA